MKRIYIFIIFSMFVWSSCNSKENNVTDSNKTSTKSLETGTAVQMTKAMFLEKVMDYEKNPNEWVYKGDKPCIIDFYADWCKPCKVTSPILDEIAKEYAGKLTVYKVNTELEQELAGMFGIRSIPSFLYCPMQGKPSMMSGIASSREETKQMFIDNIDKLLLP
ncbi:MAG: thiol reductase thioredoxin [Bacteroidales bacterium]|nr:thiol reductase thioredoxin [Bacteroidales bacterium]